MYPIETREITFRNRVTLETQLAVEACRRQPHFHSDVSLGWLTWTCRKTSRSTRDQRLLHRLHALDVQANRFAGLRAHYVLRFVFLRVCCMMQTRRFHVIYRATCALVLSRACRPNEERLFRSFWLRRALVLAPEIRNIDLHRPIAKSPAVSGLRDVCWVYTRGLGTGGSGRQTSGVFKRVSQI